MEHLLEVKGDFRANRDFLLQDVEFHLEPGYIMGLIGQNGAGKTTLINCILGLHRNPMGAVKIGGYDTLSNPKEAKGLTAFVLEDNPFEEEGSALLNGRIYGRFYKEWNEGEFKQYLKRFEVNPKKSLKRLSRGMKIKFQLAFALSHDARLFVMDEPAAGLDPVFRRELKDIMYDIVADGERSILISSHITDELEQFADYITMLHDRRMLLSMSMEELKEKYRLIRAGEGQLEFIKSRLLGIRKREFFTEGLILNNHEPLFIQGELLEPHMEDLMEYAMKDSLLECKNYKEGRGYGQKNAKT